jgi:hypothetical protein
MGRGFDKRVFFLFSLVAAILVFVRGTAMADMIGGSLEWSYGSSDSKETDATGLSTRSSGSSYFQRYNLSFTSLLYPQLVLSAGGTFDKTISISESPDGQKARTSNIDIMPTASLVFFNPFVSGGVGFSRRQEKSESGGASPQTEFQDSKNAFLQFRPEGLPTLNMQFTRSNRYDKERERENVTSDSFALNSAYELLKNLNLSYSSSVSKNEDKLNETDSTTETQSGRASYSRQLLKNRVSFSADYLRSHSSSETSSGLGALKLPLFPFAGLSVISIFNAAPPPSTVTVNLSPTQALIDGNLTASTGINIGQSVSQGGDTRFREVGIDFVNATLVNTLDVFVVLNQANQSLPAGIADNFTWYIYTSPDNQNWTLYQAGLKAAFDPFSNRFEITFPDVTTRFIMAAVQPLSIAVVAPPGVDVSNIFMTELQAFIISTSTVAGSKSSQGSEFYDLNVRASVLKSPMLIYNMYYSHAKNDPGITSYTLGNSLSLSQRLSRVLTGTARVAREDAGGSSPGAGRLTYLYSAALMAVPLPTLSSSLVMSGSRTEAQGVTSNNNSLFLANSARLYKGIDVSLSGGASRSSSSTGTDAESTTINFGAGVTPHRNMTINVNYGTTTSRSSVEGMERPPNRTQNATGSATYRPVETVYLVYSISEFSSTNSPRQTSQNYSASWAPLSSGALQVSFSYSENVRAGLGEGFDRAKSAGVSWRVGPRMFLSAGYSVVKSETVTLISESKSFSADLTMNF